MEQNVHHISWAKSSQLHLFILLLRVTINTDFPKWWPIRDPFLQTKMVWEPDYYMTRNDSSIVLLTCIFCFVPNLHICAILCFRQRHH